MAGHGHGTIDEKMSKTIEILRSDLNTVRAGRANPALLDKIMVNYYGSPTPLKNLSNISVPEPRLLMVAPFDPSVIVEIEKAIIASDIGINPTNDGKVIRLAIPQLTEERRKELTKQVKAMGEDAKIAIRNVRREENERLKKAEKDEDISEDEIRIALEDVQKKTDKAVKDIDDVIAAKEKEIMEV